MINTARNKFKLLIATLAFAGGTLLGATLVPATVAAAPVDVLSKCNSESKVCQGTGKNALYDLIGNVVRLLILIIGIISVIMIVIGGFRYTTSGGDSGETKTARDTIIYAVVGLVIAIMSYSLVNFVLNQLK
jgi:hypothetical protein